MRAISGWAEKNFNRKERKGTQRELTLSILLCWRRVANALLADELLEDG
jgi:hypothetical protein